MNKLLLLLTIITIATTVFSYPLQRRTWGYGYGLDEEKGLAAVKDFLDTIKNTVGTAESTPEFDTMVRSTGIPNLDLLNGYLNKAKGTFVAFGSNPPAGWTKANSQQNPGVTTYAKYMAFRGPNGQGGATTPGYMTFADGLYNGIPVRVNSNGNGYLVSKGAVLPEIADYLSALEHLSNVLGDVNDVNSPMGKVANFLNTYRDQVDDKGNPTPNAGVVYSLEMTIDTIGTGQSEGALLKARNAAQGRLASALRINKGLTGTIDVSDPTTYNKLSQSTKQHVIAYRNIRALAMKLWGIRPDSVRQDQGFGPNPFSTGGTCSGHMKREDSCLPDMDIIGDDSFDAEEKPSDLVSRDEIEALSNIGYGAGITEVLDGYNWEGVPQDWDDYTELDHNMIFKGSENLDDALEKLEDAINAKLDEDPDKLPDRKLLARGLVKFRQAVRTRVANLKAQNGDIKIDKQITAEARKNAVDRLADKYKDTFGNTIDMDNPDNEGKDPEYFSDENTPDSFDDYRPPEVTASIAEADTLSVITEVLYDDPTIGSINDAPNVGTGGEAVIDVTHMVPGSTGYMDTWKRLMVKVALRMDQNSKLAKWQYRRLRVCLNKLRTVIEKREAALDKKVQSDTPISAQEVDEYEGFHGIYKSFADNVAQIKPSELDPTDKPDPDFAPDPGYIPKLPAKKVFKPASKSVVFNSGIRSIKDSLRKFKKGSVKSTHGTRRNNP